MKIAIIVLEDTMNRCTGSGCMNAFFKRTDSFARYAGQENVELAAYTHNGGDMEKKIDTLIKKGVDVVHLSSCLRGKDPNYEKFAKQLSKYFSVVGYTHGQEIGSSGPSIVLQKAQTSDNTCNPIDSRKKFKMGSKRNSQ